jgi:hypothetical protein
MIMKHALKYLCRSIIVVWLVSGCNSFNETQHPAGLPLRYHAERYSFTFFLPASWQGYSVIAKQWISASPKQTGLVPMIVLRHPCWKTDDRYEDIPILVFTRRQWEATASDNIFAGGVAEEVGQNREYVFAIHNRFNWDQLKGWKEAGEIVELNSAANKSQSRGQFR